MSNQPAALSATLVDEWVRNGLRHAVVAPGSRSTPLALALLADHRISTEIVLDERSAGFCALGIGLATGVPALVVTTSGTAAVELHPAVVEAHLAQVPLVVCTADRPPELHHVGAPQTVDQQRLYGHAVRWFADLGAADVATRAAWRSFAARAVAEACGSSPGPVQLNLPFREPLVGAFDDAAIPSGRPAGRPWHRRVVGVPTLAPETIDELVAILVDDAADAVRPGVIVAGAGADGAGAASAAGPAVLALARRLGWPVLADPRSGCRVVDDAVVAHADGVVRVAEFALPAAAGLVTILQVGSPHASKVLGQWLAAAPDARRISVDPAGTWWDPDRRLDLVLAADVDRTCGAIVDALTSRRISPTGEGWLAGWRAADDAAEAVCIDLLDGPAGALASSEPGVARAIAAVAALEPGASLVVSSSMPIRDLEWYGARGPGLRVLANRGANGIDGVVSTAVGVALASAPATTWLLIGDLALLHDSNGLHHLVRRVAAQGSRLRIVVVDNEGGGIFSFLPQAGVVAPSTFEQAFGTPHDLDLGGLFHLHGIPVEVLECAASAAGGAGASAVDALGRLASAETAVAALVVRTGARDVNVAVHDRIHRAQADAVRRATKRAAQAQAQ